MNTDSGEVILNAVVDAVVGRGSADSLQPKVESLILLRGGIGMPGERLSMRKIHEVLRLRFGHGLSQHAVARSLQLSAGAVNGYLSRARRAGIGWPVPDDLDDEQLERRLFPLPADVPADLRDARQYAAWPPDGVLSALASAPVFGKHYCVSAVAGVRK